MVEVMEFSELISLLGSERYLRTQKLVGSENLLEWFDSSNEWFDGKTPYETLKVERKFDFYDEFLEGVEQDVYL